MAKSRPEETDPYEIFIHRGLDHHYKLHSERAGEPWTSETDPVFEGQTWL